MWKFAVTVIIIAAVVIAGFSLIEGTGEGDINAQALLIPPAADLTGFSQAIEPYDWQFPRDHGAHTTFQTEWWYYTGNLQMAEGRHFGYQFTIFRRALVPEVVSTASDWRTGQVYMVHFTLSDIDSQVFYHDERYSRGGAGLAGSLPDDAHPDETYRVFVENWQVTATSPEAAAFHLTAASDQGFSVDLTLEQIKPPALQGNQGLSPKSQEVGNASYYYSLSRLLTSGEITVNGEKFTVSGNTWMDHEFSTSALGANALGWDWFGLQFADGRDLMVGKIRRVDGSVEPAFGGLLIEEDGSTRYLQSSDFAIVATGEWHSPHTNAVYPAGWTITIDGAAIDQPDDLQFTVTPLANDQELHSGAIGYWEGAVALSGAVTGYGYAELTGYFTTLTGRF